VAVFLRIAERRGTEISCKLSVFSGQLPGLNCKPREMAVEADN